MFNLKPSYDNPAEAKRIEMRYRPLVQIFVLWFPPLRSETLWLTAFRCIHDHHRRRRAPQNAEPLPAPPISVCPLPRLVQKANTTVPTLRKIFFVCQCLRICEPIPLGSTTAPRRHGLASPELTTRKRGWRGAVSSDDLGFPIQLRKIHHWPAQPDQPKLFDKLRENGSIRRH